MTNEKMWIGPSHLVQEALQSSGAEEDENGQFIINGPKAEPLFNGPEFLVIGPETTCICSGRSVPLVDILPAAVHNIRLGANQ